MVDILSKEARSRQMSRVRGKDTRIELLIRKGLHSRGFRYSLHTRALPGRPDIALPKHRAVVQVHGCFWHGHDCPLFRIPGTRPEFWAAKIRSNQVRDVRNLKLLRASGWRVFVVWECAVRGRGSAALTAVIDRLAVYLRGPRDYAQIRARRPSARKPAREA